MIRYALKCSKDHGFDSWFQSAEAFDKLRLRGLVTCMVCGDKTIAKSLMAPSVRPARNVARNVALPEAPAKPVRPLSEPANQLETAIAAMRRQIEENSDYVGMSFAAEARRIHAGTAPERSIWGEARPDEARALIEDGVAVAPLPFIPARKTN